MMKYYYINIETLDGIQENIICITDAGTQIGIPKDAMNPDYLEYVQWLFDGNTPEEWQPEISEER
jgi:hypothetical protein